MLGYLTGFRKSPVVQGQGSYTRVQNRAFDQARSSFAASLALQNVENSEGYVALADAAQKLSQSTQQLEHPGQSMLNIKLESFLHSIAEFEVGNTIYEVRNYPEDCIMRVDSSNKQYIRLLVRRDEESNLAAVSLVDNHGNLRYTITCTKRGLGSSIDQLDVVEHSDKTEGHEKLYYSKKNGVLQTTADGILGKIKCGDIAGATDELCDPKCNFIAEEKLGYAETIIRIAISRNETNTTDKTLDDLAKSVELLTKFGSGFTLKKRKEYAQEIKRALNDGGRFSDAVKLDGFIG